VLVERGSILSHAALVARELGVPCVVGIPGLLDTLRDGEEVEMDGATGIVRRVKEADSA
jgi:rifampicin phosphotransferase